MWAQDPTTGQSQLRKVVQTYQHVARAVVTVSFAGATVQVTPEHPFWVLGKGWLDAAQLRPHDRLRTLDGVWPEVAAVSVAAESVPVYNLQVEGDHDYFVTSTHVLVHNTCTADLGDNWVAKSAAEVFGANTCTETAKQIQSTVCGRNLPDYLGESETFATLMPGTRREGGYHDVVIKDGRVFDATTGRYAGRLSYG
ncbi:Hint domain-containing protein [Amycolatopsis viridis]|uniref:Hint domain-containing protein n=1 Tax=Amycolatopsis viridis TaxID=185678 RepID=UPI0036F2DA73